jgi:uncharacterized membrane protein YfcA
VSVARARGREARGGLRALLEPRLLLVGILGGLLSGLLGVGGGLIMVPLLVMLAGYDQRTAHAMSLGAIIPIGTASLLTYSLAGEVHVPEALALLGGSLIGARIGAGVLARIDERALKTIFGLFLLGVAVLLVLE